MPDTVKIKIENNVLADHINESLGSKPSLTTKSRNRDGRRLSFASGYETQMEGNVGGYHVYFAMEPRWKNRSPGLLQFHLSHFESMRAVQDWLEDLFGPEATSEILGSPIERLDLCMDLALPFETLERAASLPGCRRVEKWSSDNGRTIYLGQYPAMFRLYEKFGVPASHVDYWPDSQERTPGNYVAVVRIELELQRHKVPIQNLSQLSAMADQNPFGRLRLESFGVEQVIPVDSHVVHHFLKRVHEVGAAAAKKEFNVGGNFAKTIGPYVGPVDIDLAAAWQTRITRFLGTQLICSVG